MGSKIARTSKPPQPIIVFRNKGIGFLEASVIGSWEETLLVCGVVGFSAIGFGIGWSSINLIIRNYCSVVKKQ